MCIIIYQPEGAKFKPGLLRNLFHRNSDGFGLFYADEGRIHVEKIVNPNEESIIKLFEEFQDRPLAMHLCLMTHGIQDKENTHPYRILNKRRHGIDLWMAHNGVLDVDEEHAKRSDTWHFVEYFLRPALASNPHLLQNTSFRKILTNAAGSNKLLFLDGKGEVTIINERLGTQHQDTGCWLSNTHGLGNPLTWYSNAYTKNVKNAADPYHPEYKPALPTARYEDWDNINPTGKAKYLEGTGFNYVMIRGARCVWDLVERKYYPLEKVKDNKSFIYSTHLHKYIETKDSDEEKKDPAPLIPKNSSIPNSPLKKIWEFFPKNKNSNIVPFKEPADINKEESDSFSEPIPWQLNPLSEELNKEVVTTHLFENDFDIWEEEGIDKGIRVPRDDLSSNEWAENAEWTTYIVDSLDTKINMHDLYAMTHEDLLLLIETQPECVADYILTDLYGKEWPSIWTNSELKQFKKKE